MTYLGDGNESGLAFDVVEAVRTRRSTIERFNDELAVLDRPLENEVEYYDDPPTRAPWRRVMAVAGGAVLLGVLATFAFTHRGPSISDDSRGMPAVTAASRIEPAAVPSSAQPIAPIRSLAQTRTPTATVENTPGNKGMPAARAKRAPATSRHSGSRHHRHR